jgi:hypothetical protein
MDRRVRKSQNGRVRSRLTVASTEIAVTVAQTCHRRRQSCAKVRPTCGKIDAFARFATDPRGCERAKIAKVNQLAT